MRVNIEEIKEQGLRLAWDIGREQVDDMVSGDPAGYRATAPASATASLEKLDDRVLLDASGVVRLTCPCGRCLSPVETALPISFQLSFVPGTEQEPEAPHGADRGHVAASSPRGHADEEIYSGKHIDLDPIFREQVLLALPAYPVCQVGCKGLCPSCGANLNEAECGCDRRAPDPRWAPLKGMLKT